MLFIILAFLVVLFLFVMGGKKKEKKLRWQAIPDKYQSLQEVNVALREAGLESSNVIVGIDYTKSNEWTGKRTFKGKCLHHISATPSVPGAPGGPGYSSAERKEKAKLNPYQQVIALVGRTLSKFDDDSLIPAFGFGDSKTQDHAVFSINTDRKDGVCHGMEDVLERYAEITPTVKLSGPTSFKPIIDAAIQVCARTTQYHILIIIADGQVTNKNETVRSIVRAANYPLSIIMVGVGDGPWGEMERFDDELPERKFDNFQFVDFHSTTSKAENEEVSFAVNALMEVPDQFAKIKELGLLGAQE